MRDSLQKTECVSILLHFFSPFHSPFPANFNMSHAPQDSQATIPYCAPDTLEFSCGQVISSSNPSSDDSDNHDDQLEDSVWTRIEIPDSPSFDASPVPPIVLEQSTEYSQDTAPSGVGISGRGMSASQPITIRERSKRKREADWISLTSVTGTSKPLNAAKDTKPVVATDSERSYFLSQYQGLMQHIMTLTDRIATLRPGSSEHQHARSERRFIRREANTLLDVLYPLRGVDPNLRTFADLFKGFKSKKTKTSK